MVPSEIIRSRPPHRSVRRTVTSPCHIPDRLFFKVSSPAKAKLIPQEIDPPEGVEPAHWVLLTTHTVDSLEQTSTITGYYRDRWVIEQVFRTCKTQGFNIEALRIEEDRPFTNLAAATLIAAIQIMQLVRDRDGNAERPLTDTNGP
jgi:hypothetical protein